MNEQMIKMLIKGLGINPEHFEKVAATLPGILNRFEQLESKVNRCLEILEGEVLPDDGIGPASLPESCEAVNG